MWRDVQASKEDFLLLYSVLSAASDSHIDFLLSALPVEACDALMRQLYRGLAFGNSAASACLFRWHERLTQHAGLGCVVRSLVPIQLKRQATSLSTPSG